MAEVTAGVKDETKVDTGSVISVQHVSEREYRRAVSTVENEGVEVDMRHWVEVPMDQPIKNVGASACLIIYVFSPETQTAISGHFVTFNMSEIKSGIETYSDFKGKSVDADSTILTPTRRDLSTVLTRQEDFDEVINYQGMMKRIKELVDQSKTEKPVVYLFGQNIGHADLDKEEVGTEDLMEAAYEDIVHRFHINNDLANVGIVPENIHDYRYGDLNVIDVGDDTLYLPEDRTILHARGEV